MGQPRTTRRKVVTVLSDEDESPTPNDDATPQSRSTGKLKAVKKPASVQQLSPISSTQNGSSQKSPAKSKPLKAKSKTAAKDPPKPDAKPIYSFFNAATQKLQNSQPSASPEKPPPTQEEAEVIHDDTDDDEGSNVKLAKGSSTALALRKRKVQNGDSFDHDSNLALPASQKFRKATGGERIPSFSLLNEDKRPWTDQFPPKDVNELAVHKRKVADVRQWLEMTISGHRQRVLVLKGAAGTGKTTTIRLLAKDLGLEVTDWKNPAGGDFAAEGAVSTAAQFDEFVSRAGRSGGLKFASSANSDLNTNDTQATSDAQQGERRQLLLVEEFPNTFSRSSSTLQSFRSAIMQYLSTPALTHIPATPLVMVVSETLLSTNTALADSFTAHRLLGPELANHAFLDTIEFNAIAHTFLLKALEMVVVKEARKSGRRRTPGPLVLKRLAESGDIRSAVSSLEFLCLRGDDGDTWSSKVAFTKQKKSKSDPPLTQSEEEALKLISNRESTLGIFHAVGKVVYNKRLEARGVPQPPSWLPQHRRAKVPENSVDVLIDELGTDASTFVAALHENYALSCSTGTTEETLDSLTGCIGSISDADLLSVDRFSYGTRAFSGSATDSLRQDEMAFQVSVRGLWFSLPYPVHRATPNDVKKRDAHQMFYPVSLKLWKQKEEVEGVLNIITAKLHAGKSIFDAHARTENSESSKQGVGAWKRNTDLDMGSTEYDQPTSGSTRTNSVKTETLLERLPYVAQIAGSRKAPSDISEQLRKITRVRTSSLDGEDDEMDLEEDEETRPEQWATDRPDVEPAFKSRVVRKSKQHASRFGEGGGLGIPVESSVEKLVLEDDDIVDD